MAKSLENILVLGASGLLGRTLIKRSDGVHFRYIAQSRSASLDVNFDPFDKRKLIDVISSFKPHGIINLVALTNVDNCETAPQHAYFVNSFLVEQISKAIMEVDESIHLVHLSTDHVYDGIELSKENDIVLRNYYAYSKFLGENMIKCSNYTILRTNFFGKSEIGSRLSFTDWLVSMLNSGQTLQLFNDQFFSPVNMKTLSDFIDYILRNRLKGTFNLGSHGGMSKAEFALNFYKILGVNPKNYVIIDMLENTKVSAKRPNDMRMCLDHAEATLGCCLPYLEDEIEKAAKEYST